jgi:hypothetical protein
MKIFIDSKLVSVNRLNNSNTINPILLIPELQLQNFYKNQMQLSRFSKIEVKNLDTQVLIYLH